MIRSIDPFAHIEGNNKFNFYLLIIKPYFLGDPEIVSNLIRFINEFWFLRTDKFTASVEEVIKNDTINANVNVNLKLRKFNAIDDILTYVEKFKDISNK